MSWRRVARSPIHSPYLPTTTIDASFPQEEAALSISDQRILYLVNIFIANTSRFLNGFSAICEEKLADVHRRILRLDATLTLLEAKLKSIDDVWELEEQAGFDVAGSSNQPIPQSSSNKVSSPITQRGSGDPSSSSVIIQQETIPASTI